MLQIIFFILEIKARNCWKTEILKQIWVLQAISQPKQTPDKNKQKIQTKLNQLTNKSPKNKQNPLPKPPKNPPQSTETVSLEFLSVCQDKFLKMDPTGISLFSLA